MTDCFPSLAAAFAGAAVLTGIAASSAAALPVEPLEPRPPVVRCQVPATASQPTPLRPQETNMWCWAASGQMVMETLGRTVRQCTQANNRLGRNDCCNSPTPQDCIKGGWPEFQKYGFSFSMTQGAPLSWAALQRQLARGESCRNAPVAFSWGWTGGGGHMMVAKGYKTVGGTRYVEINDPWAPNVGDHRFITYDFYVASPGSHTHWNDYYNIARAN